MLSGNFRQAQPVIPKSTPAEEINACLENSVNWKHVKIFKLTINGRPLSRDEKKEEFSEKLLRIGEGTYPIDEDIIQITLTNELDNVVETPEQLINELYASIAENYTNSEWLCKRTI
ncbi:hypothetical protein EVAR_49214_1 [Eumeta japonica]|uniref:ATP-dependent DNA helicase n=1 Tax=Eumeta variegata TaxID=151549 RepID=A0A4C1XP56_EUMVA|nr:hypothetical protein EVAR_49214_1 [Eumeta japonica]